MLGAVRERLDFLWAAADWFRSLLGLPEEVGGGMGRRGPAPAPVNDLMLWALMAAVIWCAAPILRARKPLFSAMRTQALLFSPKYALALVVALVSGADTTYLLSLLALGVFWLALVALPVVALAIVTRFIVRRVRGH